MLLKKRTMNQTFSTVNTMDWEALDFYKKLGYEVEFERHGFLKDSIFYFLRKEYGKETNKQIGN
jgi:ribosomal protein S18 acetylase RimI-like enzyme